jgi:hypothetical protein
MAAANVADAMAKDGRPWWERMHEGKGVRGDNRPHTHHARVPVGGKWRWHHRAATVEAAAEAQSGPTVNVATHLGASAIPTRRNPIRNVGVTAASVVDNNNNNSIGSFAGIHIDDDSDDGSSSTSSYDSLPRQLSTQETGSVPVRGHSLAGVASASRNRRPQSAPTYTAMSRASQDWARETLWKLHVEQLSAVTPPLAPRLTTPNAISRLN